MSDTHGELYFARYDARNRLITGGAAIGPGDKAERLKTRVTERLQRLWPQIGEVTFDYVWNGWHFASQHSGVLRMYTRKVGGGWHILERHGLRLFIFYVIALTAGWSTGRLAK